VAHDQIAAEHAAVVAAEAACAPAERRLERLARELWGAGPKVTAEEKLELLHRFVNGQQP
jgi:hypothetical protein